MLDSLGPLGAVLFRVATAAQQSSEAFPGALEPGICDDAKCEIAMIRDRIPHSAHSLTAPTPTRSTFLPTRPFPGRHAHPPTLSFTLHATRVGPLGSWLSALITPGEPARFS